MAAFTFEFNQTELARVINDPANRGSNDLHIAIFSHKDTGNLNGELYLAAQSCDPTSGDPNPSVDPEVACPVPPGWRPTAIQPKITHEQLVNCPKFSVKAVDKARLLNNQHPPAPATDQLLIVTLEAEIPSSGSILVIRASCKIKSAGGGIIDTVEAEVK